MAAINEKLLDERLAALESARAWGPRVVSKLEAHVRSADDAALLRINPISFAAEKNIPEAEAVDLFLHAASLGLFQMDWVLLCPVCSCVIESFRALNRLNSHCRCMNCSVDLVAALDDMIAVTFTISSDVRRIAYHDPEHLSIEDYFFRYRAAEEGLMPDGTPFLRMKEKLHKAMAFVEPGQTVTMKVEAEQGAGALRGASVDVDATFVFVIDSALPAADQRIEVRCDENACEPAGGTVAPGNVTFEITSAAPKRFAFGIMQLPPGVTRPPPLHFAPFLSGKRLLTTQTFRDLFRSEVIRASEGIGVKDIALLFTDLKGSTALYDRIGDLNAFALVQQHFDRLHDVTVRNDGAIIKTIGDAVMAAFPDAAHAVRAALEMRKEIGSTNKGASQRELILKIGVHSGAAIAVTQNDRLDYFGQTVNIAARVQGLAEADEIFVSKDAYDSSEVKEALAAFQVEPQSAKLRGVNEEVPVFRVEPETASAAISP